MKVQTINQDLIASNMNIERCIEYRASQDIYGKTFTHKGMNELLGDDKLSKKLANNTWLERFSNNWIDLRHHETNIISYLDYNFSTVINVSRTVNGTLFNTDGWYSASTKERINKYTPSSIQCFQFLHKWYWKLSLNRHYYDHKRDRPTKGWNEYPIYYPMNDYDEIFALKINVNGGYYEIPIVINYVHNTFKPFDLMPPYLRNRQSYLFLTDRKDLLRFGQFTRGHKSYFLSFVKGNPNNLWDKRETFHPDDIDPYKTYLGVYLEMNKSIKQIMSEMFGHPIIEKRIAVQGWLKSLMLDRKNHFHKEDTYLDIAKHYQSVSPDINEIW